MNPYNTILIPNNSEFEFFAALRSYVKFSIFVLLLVVLLLVLFWNWQPWFELEIKPISKSPTAEKPALQSDRMFMSYVVRPGDTLSEIAARHGVELSVLQQYNKLDNPNTLHAGQSLKIPRP
jgi:hypothetical protein